MQSLGKLWFEGTGMYWYILSSKSKMRESNLDGDQDLNFWTREIEDLVREIMEDPIFKGNQNYKFETDLDKAGKRLYGGEANAGLAFQIGQLRYIFSKYKLVCASMYRHVLACTSLYLHALVCS